MKIDSFYVIPGYTFFYWGFTLPKKFYPDYINFFKFKESNLNVDIEPIINSKIKLVNRQLRKNKI